MSGLQKLDALSSDGLRMVQSCCKTQFVPPENYYLRIAVTASLLNLLALRVYLFVLPGYLWIANVCANFRMKWAIAQSGTSNHLEATCYQRRFDSALSIVVAVGSIRTLPIVLSRSLD
jgi:hypothetical protein